MYFVYLPCALGPGQYDLFERGRTVYHVTDMTSTVTVHMYVSDVVAYLFRALNLQEDQFTWFIVRGIHRVRLCAVAMVNG